LREVCKVLLPGLQEGFEEIDEEILERVDSVEEVLGFGTLLVIVAGDKDKREEIDWFYIPELGNSEAIELRESNEKEREAEPEDCLRDDEGEPAVVEEVEEDN
jgi:hypothetical protein